MILKPQLKEFLLSGTKYAFPPIWGAMSRGVPTGYAAACEESALVIWRFKMSTKEITPFQ